MDKEKFKHYQEDFKLARSCAFDCISDIMREFRDDDYKIARRASEKLVNQFAIMQDLQGKMRGMIEDELQEAM